MKNAAGEHVRIHGFISLLSSRQTLELAVGVAHTSVAPLSWCPRPSSCSTSAPPAREATCEGGRKSCFMIDRLVEGDLGSLFLTVVLLGEPVLSVGCDVM